MPRPKKSVPSYLHHKPTNQAYVRLPDGKGGRRPIYLGEYDSSESRAEYARIVQELSVSASIKSVDEMATGRSDQTVNELLNAYRKYAEQHYRGLDGKPTGETRQVEVVCRYVSELYGHTFPTAFGPLALKAVRQKFIVAGWCRRSINQQIERVRRAFRWAAGEELIPFEIYQRLTAVTGLQSGRTQARETEPVKPVDDAVVDLTLHHLNRHVRGLIEFQRLTGCRPGEACRLRLCDIDTGGTIWLYRPPQHKGSWRGKSRTIAIGPKAQELLKEYCTPNMGAYLFSPRRAVEEIRAERSRKRKTPRYPSHMKRNQYKRKKNPKRVPSDRYTRMSYIGAVIPACDRAFPPLGELSQREGESRGAWWGQRIRGKWVEGQGLRIKSYAV